MPVWGEFISRAYRLRSSDKMSNVPFWEATLRRKSTVCGYGSYSVNCPPKI